MSWLLDTDVICQPAKRNADQRVVAWLEQEKECCYTSAVVIAQLAYWVRSKQGTQRQALQFWLTRLIEAMHGRIHGFNVSVAHVWAEQEHTCLPRSASECRWRTVTSPPPPADTASPSRLEMTKISADLD